MAKIQYQRRNKANQPTATGQLLAVPWASIASATAAASRLALSRLILYLLCMVAYYLPDSGWPI